MCENMRKKLIAMTGVLGIIFMILFCNFGGKGSMTETMNHYLHKEKENNNKYQYNEFLAPERDIKQALEGEKICYLTFDDGPSENTVKILDILKQYDAKATFFVIGNCISEETGEILTVCKAKKELSVISAEEISDLYAWLMEEEDMGRFRLYLFEQHSRQELLLWDNSILRYLSKNRMIENEDCAYAEFVKEKLPKIWEKYLKLCGK